jgi:hypothetical protein
MGVDLSSCGHCVMPGCGELVSILFQLNPITTLEGLALPDFNFIFKPAAIGFDRFD